MKKLFLFLILCVLVGCSTTKHLPPGEVLYTGQKPIVVEQRSETPVGQTALEEVEAALAAAPNNALLGSSRIRIPFPLGLWVYNGFSKYEKGLGKWIFRRFGAKPVLLSTVAPDIRMRAAANLLHEYGYFDGLVSCDTFVNSRDSLKARLQYTVRMGQPTIIDTVEYVGFSARTERILKATRRHSLLRPESQFNVPDLDAERTRVSNLLRNTGLYYFRPDYLTYQADTTCVPAQYVSLRMVPVEGMPAVAEKPFYLGAKSIYLYGRNGQAPTDSLLYRGMRIYYHGSRPYVRPSMLYRWTDYRNFRFKRPQSDSAEARHSTTLRYSLYNLHRQNRVQERLAQTGIFRTTDIGFVPRDTSALCDTLDVNIRLMPTLRYDAELDFNLKLKSNNQVGPGASFTLSRLNVFGGGERWEVELTGSYEWQTGGGAASSMNSYEYGVSTSLVFPRVMFPRLGTHEYDFPATTTFSLYALQQDRARYYKLLAFGGRATYEFQPKPIHKHSLTPLRLTFNVLRHPTAEFQALQAANPALYASLRDQFIPAMEYTYTYDDTSLRTNRRTSHWWQTTFTSAGNVTSLLYGALGQSLSRSEKQLLGVPFAQFVKLNTEFRHHLRIGRHCMLATRMALGAVWAYGNVLSAPYTEQFYVGGANSIRAFSARSIGPGGYSSGEEGTAGYGYLNHVGDIRFEANAEWRFPILGNLHGAVFLDAGNVWLLRTDEGRPGGEFRLRDFPRQIALGTGLGLRYDLQLLVFRLDLGVALHDPSRLNSGRGYYNIPRFGDGLALNFAIGYPF